VLHDRLIITVVVVVATVVVEAAVVVVELFCSVKLFQKQITNCN
jgi:hypothetical protein